MDFWEDLLVFIEDGRVVPVVGPELLLIDVGGTKVPLYQHLATQLAADLGIEQSKLSPNFTINEVVCNYLKTGRPAASIYRRIRTILDKSAFEIPEPLKKLARIRPFKLFVSTTFDSLLEQAINQERFGGAPRTISRAYAPNQIRDEADLAIDYHELDSPTVFRLFGKVSSNPDYVVTEEDTLEFISTLQSKERRPNRLFDELKNNHLLFIGNSFVDWLSRFFIRLTRGERFLSGSIMMQYMADEATRQDSNFILFLESFGRNQAQVYTESGPVEFIDQLWEMWSLRHPEDIVEQAQPVAAGARDDEPAIFLSYAREDSEATRRIANLLESAGLKVWLDRDRILHGEEWSEKIHRSIRRCALFLPVISRNTQSRHKGVFYEEWSVANECARQTKPGEVYIVPVPIDNTEVPSQLSSKHYEVFPNGELTPEFVAWIKNVLEKRSQGH